VLRLPLSGIEKERPTRIKHGDNKKKSTEIKRHKVKVVAHKARGNKKKNIEIKSKK
jgi:hypothetical protein